MDEKNDLTLALKSICRYYRNWWEEKELMSYTRATKRVIPELITE